MNVVLRMSIEVTLHTHGCRPLSRETRLEYAVRHPAALRGVEPRQKTGTAIDLRFLPWVRASVSHTRTQPRKCRAENSHALTSSVCKHFLGSSSGRIVAQSCDVFTHSCTTQASLPLSFRNSWTCQINATAPRRALSNVCRYDPTGRHDAAAVALRSPSGAGVGPFLRTITHESIARIHHTLHRVARRQQRARFGTADARAHRT